MNNNNATDIDKIFLLFRFKIYVPLNNVVFSYINQKITTN